jgi:acetolactate decarboxylase
MTKTIFSITFAIIFMHNTQAQSQTPVSSSNVRSTKIHTNPITNNVFQYGVAEAFVNGAYKGELSVAELKHYGDFGLGAPDNIDGELTIYKGKVYQTTADGKTREANKDLKTPFAVVSFFNEASHDVYSISNTVNTKELYNKILDKLPARNSIYAIRISGTFDSVTTRAFPAVDEKQAKPLAQLMDTQHLFKFEKLNGTMIGYYMPAFLSGINISGLHFHFLSDDCKSGGHVIALSGHDLKITISPMDGVTVKIPSTPQFNSFQFKQDNTREVKTIEKGSN